MIEKPEMLAKVNAAIQRIAEKSKSNLVKELVAVQLNSDNADYLFGGTMDVWSTSIVSGQEIVILNDEQLQTCIIYKIENSMQSMIDLLEDNMALLRGK